jgi:hypothetical protein
MRDASGSGLAFFLSDNLAYAKIMQTETITTKGQVRGKTHDLTLSPRFSWFFLQLQRLHNQQKVQKLFFRSRTFASIDFIIWHFIYSHHLAHIENNQ